GLTGIDLLRKLADHNIDPCIIVITGFGSDEIHNEVEKLGAIRYFTKPFDINELADKAIALLESRANRKKYPGFRGNLGNLKMVDIIQIVCLIRQSGLLKIQSGKTSGKIYLKDGQIIHAETGNAYGEDALYNIIDWESGSFEIHDLVEPSKQTIDKSWEFLLLEQCRRKDFRNRNS
ncbi:DUF4388 domain-containing protein, partial [bacterium]|nr:DUF4388 domain-containing protein [candidate division CSSED10-310 bacterium]